MFIVIIVIIGFLLFIALALGVAIALSVKKQKQNVLAIKAMHFDKLSSYGSVNSLSITPLMDFYTDRDDMKTEAGVSYLIKADDLTILFDFGANQNGEHPSPLIQNMEKLGISVVDIDMIFLSHIHNDHVGGFEESRNKCFSLSKGKVSVPEVTVYSPVPVTPSQWNPGLRVEATGGPRVLAPGIVSLGPIPRNLLILGNTEEQAMAVNVKGKGLVLIIGCGHPTVQEIVRRARQLFNEPIYGIFGGLHFPVNGGRVFIASLNAQKFVSTANPFKPISEADTEAAIDFLKKEESIRYVSLSPHDSSDWSLEKFRTAFGAKYRDLLVGKTLEF